MNLTERKLDPNEIYFHGSSSPELKKSVSAPSCERPFFCCPDLDYSLIYANMENRADYEHSEGRQRWKKNKSKAFVYAVSLSEDIKIFDPRVDSTDEITKIWPRFLINRLTRYGSAFYEAAWRIRDKAKLLTNPDGTVKEDVLAKQRAEFGELVDEFNQFIVTRFKDKLKTMTVEDVVTEWCKDLKKAGYHAFSGPEGMENSKRQFVRTDDALGIFDPKAFKTLCVAPLDYRKCKKALEILGSRDERDEDSREEMKDAIRRFVADYNSI